MFDEKIIIDRLAANKSKLKDLGIDTNNPESVFLKLKARIVITEHNKKIDESDQV